MKSKKTLSFWMTFLSLESITFFKIDVEGYEFQVLKDATKILQKYNYIYLKCILKFFERNDGSEAEICRVFR